MATKVSFHRGSNDDIKKLSINGGGADGALYVATDTGDLYLGQSDGKLLGAGFNDFRVFDLKTTYDYQDNSYTLNSPSYSDIELAILDGKMPVLRGMSDDNNKYVTWTFSGNGGSSDNQCYLFTTFDHLYTEMTGSFDGSLSVIIIRDGYPCQVKEISLVDGRDLTNNLYDAMDSALSWGSV